MIRKNSIKGFTLIELVVFIVVSVLMMSVLLLDARTSLTKSYSTHTQWVALQTAQSCMEWFIGQRRINGFSTITCTTSTPAACTAPSGYSVSATVTCNWNGDTNYKQIDINVSGTDSVTLSTIIGSY